MTRVLLAIAVVVSLWPAAVIALAADRVLGGGDEPERVADRTATATAPRPAPRAQTTQAPAVTTTPGELDLDGFTRLRDDTAALVTELNDSYRVASGQPDSALAAQALDIEAALVAWQERNEGTSPDAEFFVKLYAAIASAAADFATAPSPHTKARLDAAVERHRRKTLQGGM